VVNAAGADLMRPFGEMSSDDWARILAVNLTGPCQVCRAALPALQAAGRGTVVNIASGAALRPLENRTAYCAAKAGLVMFGKALAIDLAPFNVRVNAICPGIIDTPMFRASFEAAPDVQAEFARILDRYVIKRVGQPDDIAHAALFLTGDESAYVTGSALAVDGGRTFH
jgi:NAD(P)-dependent dehydrogenase (short-subunit alcohol dehydrogenase family)